MAGAILISPEVGVSTNTFGLSLIAEKTREHLRKSGNSAAIKEIYRPYDEEYMSFISLIDQDESVFNAFYIATKKAYELALAEKGTTLPDWEELLTTLQADPRWRPTSSGG